MESSNCENSVTENVAAPKVDEELCPDELHCPEIELTIFPRIIWRVTEFDSYILTRNHLFSKINMEIGEKLFA